MLSPLLILAPGFDWDSLHILVDYGPGEEPRLLDLGKQGDVVVDGYTAHLIPIVHLLHGMLINDVDGKVDLVAAEMGQYVGRLLLVYLVQHGRLYTVLAQKCAGLFGCIQWHTKRCQQYGGLQKLLL